MNILRKQLAVRVFRKVGRSLDAMLKLMHVWVSQGSKAAYHAYHERNAVLQSQWSKLRLHLGARLNMLGALKGHPLNAVFQALGCHNVVEITHDLFVSNKVKVDDRLRDLPCADIGDLYEYFRYFGDFRIANTLRILLMDKWVGEQMMMSHVSPEGLNAALELGKPQLVIDLLRKKQVRLKDREYVREVKAMAHALLGDLSAANKLWEQGFQSNDYLFRELISGRSIAVVGPAPTSEKIGAEIDSFDLVVRTNYRVGSNFPTNIFGTRTDISYYNQHRMLLHSEDVVNAANSLRWTILRVQNNEAKFRKLFPKYEGSTRSVFDANSIFFGNATPMAVPNILNDLTCFSPSCIKLFCTTFFGSEKAYNEDYHYRAIPSTNSEISENLRTHEPFSGFTFVQNLHRAGLCKVDRLTEEVLDLNREQYAEIINKQYGKFTCK